MGRYMPFRKNPCGFEFLIIFTNVRDDPWTTDHEKWIGLLRVWITGDEPLKGSWWDYDESDLMELFGKLPSSFRMTCYLYCPTHQVLFRDTEGLLRNCPKIDISDLGERISTLLTGVVQGPNLKLDEKYLTHSNKHLRRVLKPFDPSDPLGSASSYDGVPTNNIIECAFYGTGYGCFGS